MHPGSRHDPSAILGAGGAKVLPTLVGRGVRGGNGVADCGRGRAEKDPWHVSSSIGRSSMPSSVDLQPRMATYPHSDGDMAWAIFTDWGTREIHEFVRGRDAPGRAPSRRAAVTDPAVRHRGQESGDAVQCTSPREARAGPVWRRAWEQMPSWHALVLVAGLPECCGGRTRCSG